MHIARDLSSIRPASDAHVTIGVFDGVHCGHQYLVRSMTRAAHAAGKLAIAYTFDPHPLLVLGREPPPLLTTLEERAELMATLGLDVLVVPQFTLDTVHMRAADFTRMLVQYLRMSELWAGPDFALGYQREGNIPCLQRLGAEQGFIVRVVAPLVCEGARVSSSRIRTALASGNVSWATQCLGRPYRLSGIAGPRGPSGRAPQARTVSVSVSPRHMVPAPGVYVCVASTAEHASSPAVVYIGAGATRSKSNPAIEACLPDLEEDVQGREISLDFVAWLRSVEQVMGDDQLAAQVRTDVVQARALLAERSGLSVARTGCLTEALDLE